MKVKLIKWADWNHNTNISLEFSGMIYHLLYEVHPEYDLDNIDIPMTLSNILYFDVNEDEEIEKEACVLLEDFNPHEVIFEDEQDAYYHRREEMSDYLYKILAN